MNESFPTRSAAESLGFPPGYFSIRSLSNGKLWDIHGNFDADSTLVYLWREKEKSLVENLRDPRADNQVFYIDYTGALCSKASGHAIDIEDGRVVLRRHRPMTFPYPNAYSHPLPRFAYDSSTGNIHVKFSCDPSYPLPSPSPSTAWRERQYLVSSVPKQKPPSVLDNAALFISSAISIVAPVANSEAPVRRDEEGEYDLKEYEIVEEERSVENEVDDSSDIHRDICVLSLPLMSEQGEIHGGGSSKARERRRWEILPISKEKATFKSPVAKSPTRPTFAPIKSK